VREAEHEGRGDHGGHEEHEGSRERMALLSTSVSRVLLALVLAASWCGEKPSAGPSLSVAGALRGGVQLKESPTVRVMPRRHRARCLDWGTERLVRAIEHAAAKVGGPALGVGDLSRAGGGPISFSHSHQSGRDADLAFYALEGERPVTAEDLTKFDEHLKADGGLVLDVRRQWRLVQALLEDSTIDVRWMFVSEAIRTALLAEGARVKAPAAVLARAGEVLHQPSDAPPHDDHLHLRIRCTAEEREAGCR
jgi:penicillin-insensitive murein endopeptidase